ncbi:N-acetyl-gamma-glutamyl-phosphate reductase [Senegalimassilia anaerobia]|uniref:N-acetyl-gamma-glutamyl-phosphate reductase n=1 Tax=Senegalimassilia anaerobia TaxID=1473216 RepID=UPI002E78AD05|nr:N-acetyl-gamma-glutamyl-phosphate reductase [Senegalimassilia anaerobia]MEE0227279.1 N-acetyl-gamma-glutamyl-phosphate reductase [Senegalimassilia anaerobia]
MSIKCGIVGAAGFAGIELVRVALRHPEFELVAVTSNELAGTPVAKEYPCFTGATELAFSRHDDPVLDQCDVVFLAVPHTAAMAMAPRIVDRGGVVVDLSADFRLKDPAVYEQWYKVSHTQTELLKRAAFGLPELFPEELAAAAQQRKEGKGAVVGCAGCYPTATTLAAAPAVRLGLVDDKTPIVVDAISGVTGAGKKATARTHFCFANENLEAYGVATHRHTPEIEQILGVSGRLVFTPHLAPLNRGLLSTVNLPLATGATRDVAKIIESYKEFYQNSAFVTVLDQGVMPKTSSVVGTNCAHIGLAVNERVGMLIAVGAIDNLCKGAANQAVQCANIVFGLPEDLGLDKVAVPV